MRALFILLMLNVAVALLLLLGISSEGVPCRQNTGRACTTAETINPLLDAQLSPGERPFLQRFFIYYIFKKMIKKNPFKIKYPWIDL